VDYTIKVESVVEKSAKKKRRRGRGKKRWPRPAKSGIAQVPRKKENGRPSVELAGRSGSFGRQFGGENRQGPEKTRENTGTKLSPGGKNRRWVGGGGVAGGVGRRRGVGGGGGWGGGGGGRRFFGRGCV